MSLSRLLAAAAVVVALQGCAFTHSSLKVAADDAAHVAGPLGDLMPIRFVTPKLEDAREDRERIGWKKNGFGQKTADITTERSVDAIVAEAVAKAFTDTHHSVGEEGAVEITGTIERFWFEMDVNFMTMTFTGEVRCTLDFLDPASRQSFYRHSYAGSHSVDKAGGLEKTWAAIMGKALDKLVEDIVLDDGLAEALRRHAAAVKSD